MTEITSLPSAAAASSTSTESNGRQLSFKLRVLKEDLNGHSVRLDSCVFLWIGRLRTDFLLFGLGGEQSMIVDGQPAPNNQVHLQALCTKLCRIFKGKQVYFSTDIGGDSKDARYWLKFFEAIKEHLDANGEFYRISA